MSFFYDFLKSLSIDDLNSKITITTIVGYGVMAVGNFKMKNIEEDTIKLSSKKEIITISGKNLSILTISKGEIIVSGVIENIRMEQI